MTVWRVPLADLEYGPEEEKAVLEVLRSKWLTMGAVTEAFENRFAGMLDAPHALALANGTVALHLACLAVGVQPGDEVIVPALTFVATANAARYAGAQVRFADILGPQEPNIAPAAIEAQITDRTRAVIVVHYAGFPCRMPQIMDLARRHGLAVIEDAAHAPGARLDGRALGTWGDAGCFSFFSNKNLAIGEGGMLVTRRADVAEQVGLLRSHGMTSLTWDRHRGHAYSYDVVAPGFNYRLDELRSALGLAQLEKLPAGNARRKALAEMYWEALSGTGLELPFRDSIGEAAYHIFPVLLPEGADRKSFIDSLRIAGVQTSIHYPPVHQFSLYRKLSPDTSLPQTEAYAAREVTLPLYPGMVNADVDTVLQAVKAALEAA